MVGESVWIKVLDVDEGAGKMSLSMSAVNQVCVVFLVVPCFVFFVLFFVFFSLFFPDAWPRKGEGGDTDVCFGGEWRFQTARLIDGFALFISL